MTSHNSECAGTATPRATSRRRQATVLFDSDTAGLFFAGQLRHDNGAGDIVAHVDDLRKCFATDLLQAIRRSDHFLLEPISTVLVSEVDKGFFDEEDSIVSPIYFERQDNSLTLVIQFLVDDYDDEEQQSRLINKILTPMLERKRMAPIKSWPDENWGAPPWLWHTRIYFNTRNRTLDELFSIGRDAINLVEALGDSELSRLTAGDLVRAGHPNVLLGQPEGHWLEVKSQHYDLASDLGQISLAQSVARFCNAETGGLIIVGASTKKVPEGEEIRRLHPLPYNARMVRRYYQALEKRLFPPPDGLSIESVNIGDEMLLLVDVPPQPEELKPFLVHGSIVGGRIEGAFISIVRRRGEASIPITAPMIHATMAAGRALLRRGTLPEESGSS